MIIMSFTTFLSGCIRLCKTSNGITAGACVIVQNLLWDVHRIGPRQAKEGLDGSRGTCKKMGGGGFMHEQAVVHLTVYTYITYVLSVRVCICLSRTHASLKPLPGPKHVHGWASAAKSSNPPVPGTTGFSSSHKILKLI